MIWRYEKSFQEPQGCIQRCTKLQILKSALMKECADEGEEATLSYGGKGGHFEEVLSRWGPLPSQGMDDSEGAFHIF